MRFFPDKLAAPLRRRKPSGIFVGDMADLFHESVTDDISGPRITVGHLTRTACTIRSTMAMDH